jgi:hypothetical protein
MVNPVSVPQTKHAKTSVFLKIKNKNPGWMRCIGFYLREPVLAISFCWKCEAYLFLDKIKNYNLYLIFRSIIKKFKWN